MPDYAALAEQVRQTAPADPLQGPPTPVDYAALADQVRSGTVAPTSGLSIPSNAQIQGPESWRSYLTRTAIGALPSIGGAVGGIVGGIGGTVGGFGVGGVPGAVAGATAGGAGGEAWRQNLERIRLAASDGSGPPSKPDLPETPLDAAGQIASEGAWQGGLEATGQGATALLAAGGRRILAPTVARYAHAHLAGQIATASDALKAAQKEGPIDLFRTGTANAARARAARDAAKDITRRGADAAQGTLAADETARTALQRQTRRGVAADLKTTKAAGITANAMTQEAIDKSIADWQAQLEGAMPPSPPASAVGQQAHRVITGPAQTALDRAGQEVEAAAKTGPDVDFTPVKAQVQRMVDRAFPASAGEEAAGSDYFKNVVGSASNPAEQAALEAKLRTALADQLGPTSATHPLPRVLAKVLSAPDTLPFAEAHQYKRLVTDAINYDRTSKTQLQGITKATAGAIRSSLSGHAPYDAATAAYQSMIPLYRKGLTPAVVKSIAEDPEYLLRSIRPTQPTRLALLKDVLTTQAAAGGAPEAGQSAWQAVQDATLHKHLISGPIEKLGARLDGLNPEFVDVLASDDHGSQVVQNLHEIAAGYQQALDDGTVRLAQTKNAGDLAYEAAKTRGASTLEAAKDAATALQATAASTVRQQTRTASDAGQAVRDRANMVSRARVAATKLQTAATLQTHEDALRTAKDTLKAFRESSVGQSRSLPEVGADLARAAMIPGGGYWKTVSIMRLLRGPNQDELIRWAAMSPPRTQALVRAMTHPEAAGTAVADLLRLGFGNVIPEDASPSPAETQRAVEQGLNTPPGPPRLVPKTRTPHPAAPPPNPLSVEALERQLDEIPTARARNDLRAVYDARPGRDAAGTDINLPAPPSRPR